VAEHRQVHTGTGLLPVPRVVMVLMLAVMRRVLIGLAGPRASLPWWVHHPTLPTDRRADTSPSPGDPPTW
jgi:hypothetical protein